MLPDRLYYALATARRAVILYSGKRKLGELLHGRNTPNEETDEEGGTRRTQDASPKGGNQTKGRDVGA